MFLTNLTNRTRIVRLGGAPIAIPPLRGAHIPEEQEKAAKAAFKSKFWEKMFDEKIFTLDEPSDPSEGNVRETLEKPVEAPANLRPEKGRAKAVAKPKLDGSMSV